MNIKLLSLEFKNFKAIKELAICFGDITSISGENATGKTSIVDGFMWLLFGKDSKDRKDFNIKTLDTKGQELHGLEHSVTGVLDIDGQEVKLQRLYKEKWTKTKGQADKELKGHTTEYFINEVPSSMKEYQEKVNTIFEESKFKLVTSPLYFTNMKWQEQRKILLEVVGDILENHIINYNPKLKPLETLVTDGIDNFNKVTKSKISKLKEKVASIPYRIDECNNSISADDFDALEFNKRSIVGAIDTVENQLLDKNKGNEYKLNLQNTLFELKQEYQNQFNRARTLVNQPRENLERELEDIKVEIKRLNFDINRAEKQRDSLCENVERSELAITEKEKALVTLRKTFKEESERELTFKENEFMCPTCKRDFCFDDIEIKKLEMINNFNERKALDLEAIRKRGKSYNKIIENIKLEISEDKERISKITESVMDLEKNKADLETSVLSKEDELKNFVTPQPYFEGMEQLQADIKATEEDLSKIKSEDNSELLIKKKELQLELEAINKKLSAKDNNIKLKERIEELETEEKELSAKIAELEGHQFLGEEFVRTKVEMLEERINKKFKGAVTFKLFNQQINGGLSECCEALVDGVPFSNVNTAGQINAGLSIINTLTEHYGVQAPVFIDNAESVNVIGDTDSQLVKLIVSLDKTLKVEGV